MTRSRVRQLQVIVALVLCIIVVAIQDGEPQANSAPDAIPGPITDLSQWGTSLSPDWASGAAVTPAGSSAITASQPTPVSGNRPTGDATATLTPPVDSPPTQALRPARLRIPSLGIDTVVQWVGVNSDGRMGVPSNYTDVAWYEDGPTPGTPGNAVLAGHFDSTTGPAVFYRLSELTLGDEIVTATEDGREYRFIVMDTEVYGTDAAPLARIFGPADVPNLNLITCDGVFDYSRREYDQRLVVYTTLASGP